MSDTIQTLIERCLDGTRGAGEILADALADAGDGRRRLVLPGNMRALLDALLRSAVMADCDVHELACTIVDRAFARHAELPMDQLDPVIAARRAWFAGRGAWGAIPRLAAAAYRELECALYTRHQQQRKTAALLVRHLARNDRPQRLLCRIAGTAAQGHLWPYHQGTRAVLTLVGRYLADVRAR